MWDTGLFECFAVRDCGLNCCVQHCCCQPCVVASALRRGGFRDGDLFGIALLLGGDTLLDEVAGYFARRRVVHSYGIDEGRCHSLVVSCCCAPLSNLQVVNAIMVRQKLEYGCAHVRPSPLPPPPPPPPPPRRPPRMRRG